MATQQIQPDQIVGGIGGGSGSMNGKGAWSPSTVYAVGDIVTHRGNTWEAVAISTGVDPDVPAALAHFNNLMADTPLLYWRFGEASGTTANDASGAGRHGAYNGPTLGAASLQVGDTDTCADFDGTNDRVTLGSTAFLDIPTIAMEAIVRFDTLTGIRELIERDNENTGAGRQWNLRTNGTALELTAFKAAGGFVQCSGPSALATGVTYHVAATVQNGFATVYINGVAGTPVACTALVGGSGQPLWVGGSYFSGGGGSFFVDGKMDEVALFASLTPTRILSHANSVTTTPGARWRLLPGSVKTTRVITAAYTALRNDLVLADSTVAAFTVTLPGTPIPGTEVIIKKTNIDSTKQVTVTTLENIEGTHGSIVLTYAGDSVYLVFDGTTWRVISQIGNPVPWARLATFSLITSGTYGDSYLGASLDAKWSRVGIIAGDETYRTNGGSMLTTVNVAAGEYYYQATPAGDYDLIWSGRILAAASSMFGLFVVDATGKGVFGGYYNSSPNGQMVGALTAGAYPGGFLTGTASPLGTVAMDGNTQTWLRMRKTGATYAIQASIDGEVWGTMSGFYTPAAFTPARIGFGCALGSMTRIDSDVFDVR